MSAVERRLVQARGCDNGDAPYDRHRRQSAKGPRECGCTLRIAVGAPSPFVRVAREQRRALVGHPTRKSECGPHAFDFARGCAGYTTRHGIARDRERLTVSMRVSRRGLFGSLPRRTFCRASLEGRRRFSSTVYVVFFPVGCYNQENVTVPSAFVRGFGDLCYLVNLFCASRDDCHTFEKNYPEKRILSGHSVIRGRIMRTSGERVTEKKLTRPVPVYLALPRSPFAFSTTKMPGQNMTNLAIFPVRSVRPPAAK